MRGPLPGTMQRVKRPPSLSEQVCESLEQMLLEGQLAPGERLWPERELAVRFGVSRTVIREAIRDLDAKGLLEVRTGAGTYVARFDHRHVTDALKRLLNMNGGAAAGPETIYELRRPLEIEIAGLAAIRKRPEDVSRLEKAVSALFENQLEPRDFVHVDVEFHLALAAATQNRLFTMLLNLLGDVMVALRAISIELPNNRPITQDEHQAILKAVIAGDADAARTAMAKHMETSESILHSAAHRHRVTIAEWTPVPAL